jgi:hypothetical protein
MMITELPGQALTVTRPARRRSLPLDLAPLFSRGRRGSGLTPKAALGSVASISAGQHQDAAAIGTPAPTNVPLACLTGGSLARRFHAWNGRSGRRYICSVFPVNAEAPQAGFPDFMDAIVIAVGVAADGLRHPLSFFECGAANAGDSNERGKFLAEALAQSVCEWHVHLLATDPELRRRVMLDLESACAPQEARGFQAREAAPAL